MFPFPSGALQRDELLPQISIQFDLWNNLSLISKASRPTAWLNSSSSYKKWGGKKKKGKKKKAYFPRVPTDCSTHYQEKWCSQPRAKSWLGSQPGAAGQSTPGAGGDPGVATAPWARGRQLALHTSGLLQWMCQTQGQEAHPWGNRAQDAWGDAVSSSCSTAVSSAIFHPWKMRMLRKSNSCWALLAIKKPV